MSNNIPNGVKNVPKVISLHFEYTYTYILTHIRTNSHTHMYMYIIHGLPTPKLENMIVFSFLSI
jgi:hypothetical protein